MPIDVSAKKYPDWDHPAWSLARDDYSRYERAPFVEEGRLECRMLCRKGVSRPIPPGECAIAALVVARPGYLVGATEGKRAHLFFYHQSARADGVVDIGPIGCATRVCHSLVAHRDGRVFGATTDPAVEGHTGSSLFVHPSDGSLIEYGAGRGSIEILCEPVPGEQIGALAISEDAVFGMTYPEGTIFCYDVNDGKTEIVGTASDGSGPVSQCLAATPTGWIYGTSQRGLLFRFSPHFVGLERDLAQLPSIRGREWYNQADAMVHNPIDGRLYGGGTADGVLFAFDPIDCEMVSLGKVIPQPRVRAMAVALDGRVYGIAGPPDDLNHLFVYDPRRHELRDLGIPMATSERLWQGYDFSAAATGWNGELYFGESDRISHLFIYFPAPQPDSPRIGSDHE